MRGLKIAHVTSTFPPYEGGIGNVCLHQARSLSERGHTVTVFVPQANKTEKRTYYPFTVKYVKPIFSVGNASFIPSLRGALHGFDIIHLHYPFFGGDIFVRWAARKYDIPYVMTYHVDISGDTILRKTIFFLYNRLFRKKMIDDSKKVLALTDAHIRNSQISTMKCLAEKIEVVPNGVLLSDFLGVYERRKLRNNYGIPESAAVVCFIGALDRAHFYKRLDLLIETVPLLREEAYLLVIGDGDMRHTYEKLAKRLGLLQRIIFVGGVMNSKIARYLDACDLLVLPSDNESFGMVIIEAFAVKKPVVVSNLPALASVVHDGVDGLLFEQGNKSQLSEKINSLISNKAYAQKMGKAGYEKVRTQYTWNLIAEQLENIYASVINNAG
ncbi:MAG: glycosyltransferase family 4 protein [Patescibacteria group bacterium]|jgi:glycosyltransferase involved in cell wall biosynthesis